MKSYKSILNSLSDDPLLRQFSEEETTKLRAVFLQAYQDLNACCEKHGLTVMLIGGTVIGAVRHHGFIPWDDDLDVAMTRNDYEQLKTFFEQELGDKYVLSSPNYHNNAKNRFPQMFVKGTYLLEVGNNPDDDLNCIKIDIFVIDNIPDNRIRRKLKGLRCTALMAMASYASTYQSHDKLFKSYMCKTKEGKKEYQRRMFIGRLLSFRNEQKWMNKVDKAFRYKKETSLKGIPSGRGHYFGEICEAKTFVPVSQGTFEGLTVNLPGNTDAYLSNLYGKNYMTLPPVEKREKHFIYDIRFKE